MSQSKHNITFISTVHKKIGICNAHELCTILEKVSPDVVFLEALENTYSNYEKNMFSSFGVYHQKLEIKAIQKYSHRSLVEYVSVLDSALSELFDNKYNLVCENIQFQKMLDDYNSLASEQGFQFLNSADSIKLQEKMRMFEYRLLKDNKLNEAVNEDIDTYENSMMQNIYSYCRNNQFDKAIFMCGVAHRHSIIEKIGSFNHKEKMDLNWEVYGN